jgi:hypothetical protein
MITRSFNAHLRVVAIGREPRRGGVAETEPAIRHCTGNLESSLT